jgi:acetyl-CoA carboxylase biotin carboxyl carrier protein
MSLTHDDVSRILQVIDSMQDRDIHIEFGDLRIHVTRGGAARSAESSGAGELARAPIAASAPAPLPAVAAAAADPPPATSAVVTSAPPPAASPTGSAEEVPEGLEAIRAPMVGTFYRAPSPGAPPFVEAGQEVGADDTLFLLEVMKLFNSVKPGKRARVARILAENGSLVRRDQVLMLLEPL